MAQTASFAPPAIYKAGQGPMTLATGDLNGDGKPDIAVADTAGSQISIYFNNGDGTFSVGQAVALPDSCLVGNLAIGPFASKGSADLLAVCTLNGPLMEVVPNLGKGQFGTPVAVFGPTQNDEAMEGNYVFTQLDPAVGDFNGDGLEDVVLGMVDVSLLGGNSSGGLLDWYFLPSKGGGAFGAPVALNVPAASVFVAFSVTAGDFNGDGKLDLIGAAVASATGGAPAGAAAEIAVYYAAGRGDGTFDTFSQINVPAISSGLGTLLIPADVNGDGKLDVIVTGSSLISAALLTQAHSGSPYSNGVSEVTVLLGDGTGKFQQSYAVQLPTYISGAAVGDFLGTGNLDLAATTVTGDFVAGVLPTGGLEILAGGGDGTFGKVVAVPFPSTTAPTGVAAADFNGDGRPDLALAEFPAVAFKSFKSSVGLNPGINNAVPQILSGLPMGDAEVLLNTATEVGTFTDANGASFANGAQAVDSIVSAFGTGMAAGKVGASTLPLPTTLGGVTIEVKDAAGVTRQAPLFYVSPGQINYAIPDGTADGTATVTIQSGTGTFVAQQQVVNVAPGIFNANGLAAGTAEKTVNGAQQLVTLVNNGAAVPVDVSGEGTYLTLYGTGIRNHVNAVTAAVGTITGLPVAYAGAQGVYFGEDQINIQLPASLAGAGLVNVTVTVDGRVSNPVKIFVK